MALPAPAPRALRFFSGPAWWALAFAVAVVTARLTMESIQLGCTFALVILTIGLYARSRTAALVVVWAVWLVAPFLRRIFLLSEPIQAAEPLALAPFLLTAVVVGLELTQIELSERVRRLLMLAVAGYLVGLPIGLLLAPQAALFAFFAYTTALGCFVIGYREAQERRLVLPTVLMIALPLLSLYAFRQYYLPLPEWDFVWQRSADITTVGSPEEGRIRVWSTLNSPGTFATVLGAAAIALIAWGRITPLKVVGLLAVLGALALTYVRSVWLGILFAVVAIAVASRGAALKRVVPVVAIVAILMPVALGGSTRDALTERLNSFGTLGTDRSAQDRSAAPSKIVPKAVLKPLGRGLGSAGEANRLSDRGGIRNTDNAYLSLLIQVGPVGFLVVMSAVAVSLAAACRNVWRRAENTDVLVFGVLAFFTLLLFAGDQLYGIGGMIFWYMGGLAVRRRELRERRPA
jgi:hypothetical protein